MAVRGPRPWSRPREAIWQLVTGATVRTCAPIALLVGAVLSLVNQGDMLATGMVSGRLAMKLAANFVIPYVTSSTGALLAVRRRDTGQVSIER